MRYGVLRTAQSIPPRNDRGAAFLLAVYFTALFLLVLSGVSLQRSTHEQRMSTIARDSQQAFWLAEAGLDQTIKAIRAAPMNVSTPDKLTIGTGTATIIKIAQTLVAPSWEQPMPQFAYAVTSEGKASPTTNAPVTLQMTVRTNATMTGMWANDGVDMLVGVWGPYDDDQPIDFLGDVRAVSGTVRTIWNDWGTTIRGNVWIGPPKASNTTPPIPAYTNLVGHNRETDGVVLEQDPHNSPPLPDARVTGTVVAKLMQAAPLPEIPDACKQGPLSVITLAMDQVQLVDDGDPLDRSPAKDGRILICADEVNLWDHARLRFKKPTMLYLLGKGIMNDGKIDVALGYLPDDRGLTIVSDKALPWTIVGRIEGSVYAPLSNLEMMRTFEDPVFDGAWLWYDMQPYPRFIGYLVGNRLTIDGVNMSADIPGAGESSSPPQVTSWSY